MPSPLDRSGRLSNLWIFGYCVCALALFAPRQALGAPVDFSRDIKPILSDFCYKCHGPDDGQRQAGLRLDRREEAEATLASGKRAITPGDSAASELYARITHANGDERMPPVASGKTLAPRQIEMLKRWIEEGAVWRGHWAFLPPSRPEPPSVRHEEDVRNPIDRFVLSRLEAEGLEPSPPAEKETLLRRVSFDLTGLPPSIAEIDAFLADESPEAYERVVERLLASPRYGEHLARYWLDAARYGDTHGLHFDNERSLWPYRDWVIAAFNSNMPFDRFTIEQLAGDLLPNATLEQRIATGFNRCNVSTSEGGSIDDEVLVRYAVDRVETTSTVWLGLTAGCAVCHDHKFDPLAQREFYRLYAYFASVQEQAMDGNALAPPPIIKTPSADQQQELSSLDGEIATLDANLAAELAKFEYQDPTPDEPLTLAERKEFVWIEDDLPAGAKPTADGGEWQFGAAPDFPVYSGARSTRRLATGTSQHFFEGAEPGLRIGEGDSLFAYVYLDPANPPQEIMLQFNDGAWEHRAIWGNDKIEWGAAGSSSRLAKGALPATGVWTRLEVTAAEVGLAPGSIVRGWAFTQFDGLAYWDKAGVVTSTPQGSIEYESLRLWDASQRSRPDENLPAEVQAALKAELPSRTDDQKKAIRDYFLSRVHPKTRASFAPILERRETAKRRKGEIEGAIPTTMIMTDMTAPRDTFVLIRGAYDKKGESVTPGTPAFLPAQATDAPANRLGLATWLVDPGHPLTARVTVNRLWQQCFGLGIVKTAEDFGAQGAWPSHPELLDWLATEFVESGWNVQRILHLIVTSSTYRQASRVDPVSFERDPANELLARGPRFRLDAEEIRDAALATSGLLVERLGGHSVKPYQPEGLWEAVAFVGSNTSMFKADAGDALYRRGLYTFWKRTSPPPSLTTFDAPSRETCSVRRARTNTPLQALALLNDKQFFEAARKLGERMMKEGGASPEERITFAFRLVTARRPSVPELSALVAAFGDLRAEYAQDAKAAEALLAYGDSPRDVALDPVELAAYAMTANLIANLDESVTKE